MVKVQQQSTALERIALEQRLSKLGLTVGEDGTIDPASAKGVRGPGGAKGAEALSSVASAGAIGLDQAVLLEKQRSFVSFFRGREATSSEKHSAALKSLAMSTDGLASDMNAAAKQLGKSGVDEKRLDAVTRRADQVAKGLEVLIKGEANLAACTPESVRALAKSLATLTDATSAYLTSLSEAREATFAKAGDMTAEQRRGLIKSLLDSASQLERLSGLSRAISASNLAVVDPAALGVLEKEALEVSARAKLDQLSPQDALAQLANATDGIAKQNAATIERQKLEALEKKNALEEMKAKLPEFNTTGTVATLARFVAERFNPPDGKPPAGTSRVLVLGSFDLGKEVEVKGLSRDNSYEMNMLMCAMTPDKAFGDQKLVLTPHGLRVYGPSKWNTDKYTTRAPDPAELAQAGWTIPKLEKELGEVAKLAVTTPDKLKPIEVRINRDDELMTNGLVSTADVPKLMKDLEAALSAADHLRGPEVVKVIEGQVGKMSAGEFRDFMIKVMNRIAGTSRGGGHRFRSPENMTLWVFPQHMSMIRDAIVGALRKYPFDEEKGDFMGDHGLHRAMYQLFQATETGSTCWKVFDPRGQEVSISNHDYGRWTDTLKGLKPYKSNDTYY